MTASLDWTNWPLYTVDLVQRGLRDEVTGKIIGEFLDDAWLLLNRPVITAAKRGLRLLDENYPTLPPGVRSSRYLRRVTK